MTVIARQISAVTFDADNTLWDWTIAMRGALQASLDVLTRYEPQAGNLLSIDRLAAIRDEAERDMKPRGAMLLEIRREGLRRAMVEIGLSGEAALSEAYETYLGARDADLRVYADVQPALEELPSDLTRGVVTNGNAALSATVLADYFSFHIRSDEVGVEKPDPAIFDFAASAAGCTPEQIVHVGDQLSTDVVGARDAGAVSVWLNRDGSDRIGDVAPDFEISSLAELRGVMESIR